MAYTPPTVQDFKTRYARFVGVADATVQAALDDAARQVDTTWTEGDFAPARMLYAAHVLTLEGHGGGVEANLAAKGLAGIQSMRSGALSLTFQERSDAARAEGELGTTGYGRRFLNMLRQNKGGPIWVPGGA